MSRRRILGGLGGIGLAVSLAIVADALAFSTAPPLVINESASLPPGLYRRVSALPRRGDIVAVRPPAAARAYLATLGAPRDQQLLKRVAALPGDRVCAGAEGLRWPGGVLAPVAPTDRRGVALPQWRDCRRLTPDEILVLGDSRSSFDSRYFGPIPPAAVAGVYVEVLRWRTADSWLWRLP